MKKSMNRPLIIGVSCVVFILLLLVVYYWRSYRSDTNKFADLINKGNAYMEAELYQEAIECYQSALEKDPGNEQIVLAIIEGYMKLGESLDNDDDAIVSYMTAIRIRPDNRSAYWAIADIYEARNDEDAMLDILQKGFADTGDTTMEKTIERIVNERLIAQNIQENEEREAAEEQERIDRANSMLGPLLEMFEAEDYEGLKEIVTQESYLDFSDEVIGDNIYYLGDTNSDGLYEGMGLAAYENGFYYYGEYSNNARNGQGVWFKASYTEDSSKDYYLFKGQWQDDLPNGDGNATTYYKSSMIGSSGFVIEAIEGNYTNGLEDGNMTLTGTTKGKAKKTYKYNISAGEPNKIEDAENGLYVFAKNSDETESLTTDGSIRGVEGIGDIL